MWYSKQEHSEAANMAEEDPSFAKVLEIAQSLEAAEQDAKALKEPVGIIQKVCAPTKHLQWGRYHFAKNCCYSVYHNCGKKGHIVCVCPTKKAGGKRPHLRKSASTK